MKLKLKAPTPLILSSHHPLLHSPSMNVVKDFLSFLSLLNHLRKGNTASNFMLYCIILFLDFERMKHLILLGQLFWIYNRTEDIMIVPVSPEVKHLLVSWCYNNRIYGLGWVMVHGIIIVSFNPITGRPKITIEHD